MSSQQNWNNIGDQIRDALQESLASGDFRELNQVVTSTVNSALEEARRQMRQTSGKQPSTQQQASREPKTQKVQSYEQTAAGRVVPRQKVQGMETQASANQLSVIKIKNVGKVSGILHIVFGGIGTFFSACAMVGALVAYLALQSGVPFLIAGCCLWAFINMISKGCKKINRVKRAERYVQLCGNKSYINIEDLALHIGKSKRHVLKDVKKMIKLGIFPEGHLDSQESCLILNDATFRQYLKLQKERKAMELEEKVARMQNRQKAVNIEAETPVSKEAVAAAREILENKTVKEASDTAEAEERIEDPELAAMIREGNECIARLRRMNDEIEGEVISAKLYQLEGLLKEIFARIKEHPEQRHQMRKFMDYYLPTTLKLVEAYAEFDEVSVPGPDIMSAKEEIGKTLDTINQAFAELLNKLFRATVYDVTTDAQVLQTMLAKEGLTKDGLNGGMSGSHTAAGNTAENHITDI